MKFIKMHEFDCTLGVPPKCGSSAVHACLQERYGVDSLTNCKDVGLVKHELVSGRVIFVVRNPIDRFDSLWRNKCRDGGKLLGHDIDGMTPAELFGYIKQNDNHHWTPQHTLLGDLESRCPVTLVPLDGLGTCLWTEFGLGVQRVHETLGKVPRDFGLTIDIAAHYRLDKVLLMEAEQEYAL